VAGRLFGFLAARTSATLTAERGTCSKWVLDFGFAGRARFVDMRQQ
jgi:hypothetical protein